MSGFRRWSPSLRARLVALTILAGVPAIGLVAVDSARAVVEAESADRVRTEQWLHEATEAQTLVMSQAELLLRTLALSPTVVDGTPAACSTLLQRHHAMLPGYNNLTRTRRDGIIDCSALRLPGTISIRDVPSFRRALETRAFTIGDHQRSLLTGRAVVVFALPILDQAGRVREVIAASVTLSWLDALADRFALPAGASLLVFDSQGTVLTARAGASDVPPDVREAVRRAGGAPITVTRTTPAGDREQWTGQRIGRAGPGAIYAAVRVPSAVATTLARRESVRDVLAVGLCLALLVAVAWAAATRLVVRPLAIVTGTAQRLAAGDLAARVPNMTGSVEVSTFLAAFNQMADVLDERDRLFTALAEKSPDGIARLATDGSVVYANSSLGQLLGRPPGLLLGCPDDGRVPHELADAWMSLTAAAAARTAEAPPPALDLALPLGDVRRVLEVRMVAERNESGTPTAFLTVVRDVTDARQTAEALRQVQKLESIGQLAGGIAHDFNNLLTGIVGHADLALDELPAGHVARDDVQALRDAALRSTGMTRQLLMFARKQVSTLEPTDLGGIVRDVQLLLGRLLGPAVRLDVGGLESLPAVALDRGQIEQVLVNLAVNARDAMPHGGTLSIRTHAEPVDASKAARLGLETPGAYVVLDVEDNGTGMPSHVLSRIFEPFYTTKGPGKGTGLGLSTCYAIARDHGGMLTVTSHVGVGTRFSLYLPATQQRAAVGEATTQDAWRDGVDGGDERVLLVEDDDGLRSLLARVLRSRGYEVTEASDGAEALRLATTPGTTPPDLVVSDVRIPRLDGASLARQLERAHPRLPVLFITGHPDDLDADGTLDGRPVLTKPFTAVQLLHAIRERLARRAGSRAA